MRDIMAKHQYKEHGEEVEAKFLKLCEERRGQ